MIVIFLRNRPFSSHPGPKPTPNASTYSSTLSFGNATQLLLPIPTGFVLDIRFDLLVIVLLIEVLLVLLRAGRLDSVVDWGCKLVAKEQGPTHVGHVGPHDPLGDGVVDVALWQAVVEAAQKPDHHRVRLSERRLAQTMTLGQGCIGQLLCEVPSLFAALVQAGGHSLLVLRLQLAAEAQEVADDVVVLLGADALVVALVVAEVDAAVVVVTVLVRNAAPAIVKAVVPPAAGVGILCAVERTAHGVLEQGSLSISVLRVAEDGLRGLVLS